MKFKIHLIIILILSSCLHKDKFDTYGFMPSYSVSKVSSYLKKDAGNKEKIPFKIGFIGSEHIFSESARFTFGLNGYFVCKNKLVFYSTCNIPINLISKRNRFMIEIDRFGNGKEYIFIGGKKIGDFEFINIDKEQKYFQGFPHLNTGSKNQLVIIFSPKLDKGFTFTQDYLF